MDWFKGTGEPHISWKDRWFPVNFPLRPIHWSFDYWASRVVSFLQAVISDEVKGLEHFFGHKMASLREHAVICRENWGFPFPKRTP